LQGEGNVDEARTAARRTPSPSNTQVTQYPSDQVSKGAAWVGVLGAGFRPQPKTLIFLRAERPEGEARS
jgi:hypothetical protein